MCLKESPEPSRPSDEESLSELLEDASSKRKNIRTACIVCKRRKLKVIPSSSKVKNEMVEIHVVVF